MSPVAASSPLTGRSGVSRTAARRPAPTTTTRAAPRALVLGFEGRRSAGGAGETWAGRVSDAAGWPPSPFPSFTFLPADRDDGRRYSTPTMDDDADTGPGHAVHLRRCR